jgi:hypothetical protein
MATTAQIQANRENANESAKGADARHQAVMENAESSGGALDTATVLRESLEALRPRLRLVFLNQTFRIFSFRDVWHTRAKLLA